MTAFGQLSNLPVNIVFPEIEEQSKVANPFKASPGSKFQPPPPRNRDVIVKALRIPVDPRFQEIRHFSNNAQSETGHFKKLCRKSVFGQALPQVPCHTDLSFAEVVAMERSCKEASGQRKPVRDKVQERLVWQQGFETSVTKLLVDFDLTNDAQCRLNHLERMHKWYLQHGGKQGRKAKASPNYITTERAAVVLPGGTSGLSQHLSNNALVLQGAYRKKGNKAGPHAGGSQTAR